MSLLEKATLITTPTAHSNGTLHSIKGGSVADFDVVRGSAATRVNAEGLIEDIRIISGELVTNGDFTTDSNWSKTNTVIENGKATLNIVSGGMASILQSFVMTQNKTYKITFDAILLSGVGGLVLSRGGNNNVAGSLSISESGTFSQVLKWVDTDTTVGIKRSGGGDFSWSVDNISVVEVIDATNIPRIDYTTGEGVVLLEPQSTNLLTQSEALSTMQNQSTITDNVLKSPTGNVNASLVVENTTTNSHGITKSNIIPTNPSATSYTVSIFAKKKERQYIQFWLYADSTSFTSSGFDLENGTTSGNANTHKIKDFGNGWYRCSFTANVTQSTGGFNFARLSMGTSPTSFYYNGDGASGLYMFGYQLEQQSYATSYIPTSGAIATRLADSVTGAGDATTFNSTEGVLYFEGSALADGGVSRVVGISDGGYSNFVAFRYDISSSSFTSFLRGNGGAFVPQTVGGITQTDNNKIALVWDATSFRVWLNGVQVITSATNDLPVGLNTLSFTDAVGIESFKGKVKALAVFNEALTDSELECLTKI